MVIGRRIGRPNQMACPMRSTLPQTQQTPYTRPGQILPLGLGVEVDRVVTVKGRDEPLKFQVPSLYSQEI